MKALLVWSVFALVACRVDAGQGAPEHLAAPAAKPTVTDPAAQDFKLPPLPLGRVTLTDVYGGMHTVEVEIAATGVARTRGLMWRSSLAEGKGMLFIFDGESVHSFWMRNTLIALDIIFIGKDLHVVGISENAEPRTLSSRSVGEPSMYVLEVPAGWSQKVGLKRGCAVKIEGAAGLEIEP